PPPMLSSLKDIRNDHRMGRGLKSVLQCKCLEEFALSLGSFCNDRCPACDPQDRVMHDDCCCISLRLCPLTSRRKRYLVLGTRSLRKPGGCAAGSGMGYGSNLLSHQCRRLGCHRSDAASSDRTSEPNRQRQSGPYGEWPRRPGLHVS